ncbi:hypothetical protein PC117_g10792 [Phytophthora cactorum]|uniref:RxLR effector protein n=1 Tax=Phytophthora cactorum TaxID=29920 RepID=A0A8T1DFU9_9STRA|nr:hypothetical protein PC117_g10792 [Phytophthora cactorum]
MRGAYILFVAVAATLLASCDVASTTQLQLSEMTASNRIQSVDDVVNDNSSNRLLRVWHFDGDDLKNVKNLAKSLNLNRSIVKQLRGFLNRNKKDQAKLLEKYGKYLARRTP